MMTKRLILLVTLTLMLLLSVQPAYAVAAGEIYVDTAWTGSEDGTQVHPYNTLQEGIALAQAQAGGAWIFVKQTDGNWKRDRYIAPSLPGASGIPLSSTALYTILAVLSVGLIAAGWQFQRRARQTKV